MKMTFQQIRITATGPCTTNQLRDVNTICRRSWYIAAHIWKIYDLKIEVIPFIIKFSTDLTTVVKFEVYVQKWCGRSGININLLTLWLYAISLTGVGYVYIVPFNWCYMNKIVAAQRHCQGYITPHGVVPIRCFFNGHESPLKFMR